jgi:hypothetical protein
MMDRRQHVTSEESMLLGEINERTKLMLTTMTTFATSERVNAVEAKAEHAYNKIADHVKDHKDTGINRNLVLGSWASAVAALIVGLVSFLKK